MPNKDPSNYSLITYVWVIAISVWGGITHNIRKIRNGTIARFSISELVGDISISGFVGVLTFWLCEAAGFNQLWSALLIGVASHMGTRGLTALEEIAAKRLSTSVPKEK